MGSEKKINAEMFFARKEPILDLPEGQINQTADFDIKDDYDENSTAIN